MVRRFLGMSGFSRKFVPKYADYAAAMNRLLEKDVPFEWNDDCQRGFELIKKGIIDSTTLYSPNYEKTFYIECDASDLGCGGCLFQYDDAKNKRPIMFLSRKFSKAERNYSTTERELLAIVYCITKWRHYLHLTPFVVRSDHKALSYFLKMKTVSGRLARWTLILAEYNFTIEYFPGREQYIADYLSRDAIEKDLAPFKSAEEDLDFSNFVHENFLVTRAKAYEKIGGDDEKDENENELNEEADTISRQLQAKDDPDRLSMKLRKRPHNWKELIKYAHSFGHYKTFVTFNRLRMFTRWHKMYQDVNRVLCNKTEVSGIQDLFQEFKIFQDLQI
eukprot:Nk52_evm1s458 gene=Nk52_evmTU1s458